MVKVIFIISLLNVFSIGLAQKNKDMVFGKISKEEIINGVVFSDSVYSKCDVIRIDNVNAGIAFLLILSERAVISINDFRDYDKFELDHETMVKVNTYVTRNNSGVKHRPNGYGTYRIVSRINNRVDLYFVKGNGATDFFLGLNDVLQTGNDENIKLKGRIKEIIYQINKK